MKINNNKSSNKNKYYEYESDFLINSNFEMNSSEKCISKNNYSDIKNKNDWFEKLNDYDFQKI